jgi:AcrR family transcriptional regulator
MTATPAPNGSSRRTQAERRETTRLALFRATMAALLETGYAALRLSEITARAGVSSGALVHHFGSKNELIAATAAHAFEEQLQKELAIVEAASRSTDPIGEMIGAQGVFFLSPLFMVHTELSAAARSEPALAPPIRQVVQA